MLTGRNGRNRSYSASVRSPRPDLAQRLADAVRARWQPRIREQARRGSAVTTGLVIDTRARFGFTAGPGYHRGRPHPPSHPGAASAHASRLLDARQSGVGEQRLRANISEEVRDVYFRDGGRRAAGLLVESTDVEQLDFDL
ncbi:XRE family transcriptional regulator [Streptomyces sp. NPDC028722]|uniref:telomere-protecting terminal protein Tpg n=1 Tax=Streptomyces sp. NPDC028722 TaxID=3155016 RepID=UPI0033FFCB09